MGLRLYYSDQANSAMLYAPGNDEQQRRAWIDIIHLLSSVEMYRGPSGVSLSS